MSVSCRSHVVQQPLFESPAHSQLPSNKQPFSLAFWVWVFGDWGLGGWGVGRWRFGVWGLGFGAWCLGVGVWSLGFGAWGLAFDVWGFGVCAFGRLGVWAFGSRGVGALGRLGVWAFGRLGVWVFGRLCVWAIGRLGVWAFGIGRWVSHSINLNLVWTLGLPPSLPFPRTGLEFQPVWEKGVWVCCVGLDVGWGRRVTSSFCLSPKTQTHRR